MRKRLERAFVFDVFGTLVNWRDSVARETEARFVEHAIPVDPHTFATEWRSRYQPAMERVRNGSRPYISIDVLHGEMLDDTLAHFDIADAFDATERANFARAWERLDPWPDVVSGLKTLRKTALIAPCSNGSIALMTRLARHAGLPWDTVLGADMAQTYKPLPDVYLATCAALQIKPEHVTMVAAHNDDLQAARACGLRTAFIARPTEYGAGQTDNLKPSQDWDQIVTSIGDLA